MSERPPLFLNDGWTVEYFERDPGPVEFAAGGQPVRSLRGFMCSGRVDDGWLAVLSRRFDVEPILDVCLRFDLHATATPGAVALQINGRALGELAGGGPFVLDVTDWITLEDNEIVFVVPCGQRGAFGDVFIQTEPCGQ